MFNKNVSYSLGFLMLLIVICFYFYSFKVPVCKIYEYILPGGEYDTRSYVYYSV